jgi:hypothetical protein
VYTSLGLGKGKHSQPSLLPHTHIQLLTETISALQAFRKRNTEARTAADQLGTQPTTLDIAKYRSGLKNQAVVDDAEKILKNFKPVTYNVNEWIKGVEMFEGKAVCHLFVDSAWSLFESIFSQVAKAAETVVKVNEELQNLGATLANIENARPFEEVTVSLRFKGANITSLKRYSP